MGPARLRRVMSSAASYHVLIVDDDEDSRELMEISLSAAGFVTSTAAHAEEAIERLREERPDAIVLDLTLPKMSGEQLAEHVRNQPDLAAILLVATSGRDVTPATVGHFDLVRRKPLDYESLISGVRELIESRRLKNTAI